MRVRSIVTLSLFVSAAVGMTGCATNSSVHKAHDEAREAHRIANQALNTAQEANARSIRTEEMVDRSFRHSMRK